jgi:hypothetical protein
MRIRISIFLLVFSGWCGVAAAAGDAVVPATVSNVPGLPVTAAGQTITVHGTGFPTGAMVVYLRQPNEPAGSKGTAVAGVASPDGKSDGTVVTFRVPSDTADGPYLVFLDFGGQELPVPGNLHIASDASTKVVLESIWPETVYPENGKPGSEFTLVGENLGNVPSDNEVLKQGYGALPVGTDSECANPTAADEAGKVCLSYEQGMAGKKLRVSNCPRQICNKTAAFAVRVGRDTSAYQKITFSRIGEIMLRAASTAVFLLLVAIVMGLVWKGIKNSSIASQRTGVVAAFFLDRQSNSYSLSKFQVIAWTTVCVYSYVYYFLCRTFILGLTDFPQIPANWPTLLGVSAGTTVLAAGITKYHGSKGSGPIHPSYADFISSGGLIAGERFQFFVWTLIGCAGYFVIVICADPATLQNLPDINGPILTLMGVSSAGYLAGKYARQPGPIIDLLTISPVIVPDSGKTVIKLQIKGQNLSENAVIKIGDKDLRLDEYTITGDPASKPAGSDFYSLLNVQLLDAESFRRGKYVLYLINDDGQSACVAFPMNPLTMNPVALIRPEDVDGNGQVTIKLTGQNFSQDLTGTWTNPKGAKDSTPATINYVSDTAMSASFAPGAAGIGTLLITTPAKLQAAIDIQVAPGKNPAAAPAQRKATNTA